MYYVKVGEVEKAWGSLVNAIWDAETRGDAEGFTLVWNPKDDKH